MGSTVANIMDKSPLDKIPERPPTPFFNVESSVEESSLPDDTSNDPSESVLESDDSSDEQERVDTTTSRLRRASSLSETKKLVQKLTDDSASIMLKASSSHYDFASTAYEVRMLTNNISKSKVKLQHGNIMIITKLSDVSLVYLMRELVEWLLTHFPDSAIYIQDVFKNSGKFDADELCSECSAHSARLRYWNEEFIRKNDLLFDVCMTLGGDGTVLFASSLFQRNVPPTISFSLGSLGFLTHFKFEDFKKDIPELFSKKVRTNLRMRLKCRVYRRGKPQYNPLTRKMIYPIEFVAEHTVLNELTIDRGPSPYISMLELYGDGSLLTVAQSDGIIIATPTGSTAYSLSAGGSLVYPTVNAISVTPICPHTLSFRPIILPDSMNLKIKVSPKARNTSWVSFDGRYRKELLQGEFVTITTSPYMFPTVESSPTEFIDSIRRTLNWNSREEQKSFTSVLSSRNREKFVSEMNRANMEVSDEFVERGAYDSAPHIATGRFPDGDTPHVRINDIPEVVPTITFKEGKASLRPAKFEM